MDETKLNPEPISAGPIITPHRVKIVYAGKLDCSYCNMTFSSYSKRKLHERRHEGRSDAFCENCHASFHQQAYLQRHRKQCIQINQLGENIKWCDFCDHFFPTDESLKKHYRTAHGIEYYPNSASKYRKSSQDVPIPSVCDLCGLSFPTKFRLGTHKYIIHKIRNNEASRKLSKRGTPSRRFSSVTLSGLETEDNFQMIIRSNPVRRKLPERRARSRRFSSIIPSRSETEDDST